MATIEETLSQMSDSQYIEGTALEFRIFNDDPETGAEITSTAVGDHLFVRAVIPVSRNDGRHSQPRHTSWVAVRDTVLTGLLAGEELSLKVILKHVYDWMLANSIM